MAFKYETWIPGLSNHQISLPPAQASILFTAFGWVIRAEALMTPDLKVESNTLNLGILGYEFSVIALNCYTLTYLSMPAVYLYPVTLQIMSSRESRQLNPPFVRHRNPGHDYRFAHEGTPPLVISTEYLQLSFYECANSGNALDI